jgi:hypothetical protein
MLGVQPGEQFLPANSVSKYVAAREQPPRTPFLSISEEPPMYDPRLPFRFRPRCYVFLARPAVLRKAIAEPSIHSSKPARLRV